jgi:hydroxymethylpyrimidine pyrophosphatase-like HAD family hydrolase
MRVLREFYSGYLPAQIITVGDSPNDESLFAAQHFPFSVGVANIRAYTETLQHLPTFITNAAEGEGFCQICEHILKGRGQHFSARRSANGYAQ